MRVIRFFSKKQFQDIAQPTPIKKMLPEWYRQSEMDFVDPRTGQESAGLKRCIPFLDAMLTGYALVTPVDIFVSKNDDGTLKIGWNSSDVFSDFISERPKALGEKMPRPEGHYPNHLAFNGFWGFKTPKGYSLLVTHPFNRHDLPWTITSGIIDADQYSTSGNIPFFIKENFVGMIPAGTPFAQLVPIKRETWTSIKNDKGIVYLEELQGSVVRLPGKSYKKLFWKRKDFS